MNENVIPPKYLPIGTVCKLQGWQKSIMITGFGAINMAEKKIYDYLGVAYPEGQISSDVSLMFDHDKIIKIEHMGYATEENNAFQKELVAYMNEASNNILAAIHEISKEVDAQKATQTEANETGSNANNN